MKMFPLALAGTLALSVLAAGCTSKSAGGGSSAGSSAGSGTSPAAVGDAKPADTKTITYQFLRNFAAPDYPADGGEGHIEVVKAAEKAGIKGFDFKATLASGDDYNTKLNLLATSGQLPDLIDIDPKTLARFVDQGLVQPLDDYLKQAPNIMKAVPAAYWNQVKFNGKIYAIPNGTRPETFNYPSVNGLDIRQDWLDALGLKQPTNLNELHDVLKAFVTKDPDKDGKNDTVGLASHKDITQGKSTAFSGIFGAFGVIPTFWTERDGMIKKGFTLPETKQALTVLQQWYKEGLIDHDFPIMEVKQMDEKVANSITGVWDGDGYYTEKGSNPPAQALNKANPKAVVRMLEAPLGPNGKQGYAEANAFAVSPLRALSVKAQDPAKLFQYLDWSATEAGHNLITYGVEGKDFTYDKATNTINQSVSYADLYKRGFSNPIRMIFITDRRWAKQPVRDAIDIVNRHLVKNAMWNIVPAENDYPDLESKLWQEYFVKIVTGEWSVDKWDEFVQKYYAQGGKEIEKQANDLYKQLQAK
jgi:putative aldouronate transport system substrate-binding protein